jgi:spore coat polysaccharide biosynthesis protein SpsF (cytidylyltransferase family)
MNNVCIIQARQNSTRLPGKVLLPLNGHTVLAEVITRCWKIPGVNQVVCTVPTHDIEVAKEAAKLCAVTSGPEADVLHRYYSAAYVYSADNILRITADCPLISPELCGAVLGRLIYDYADYASNVHPRTFPQGYDCEVFTRDLLNRAEKEADEDDREHVTTWMLREPGVKRVNVASPWTMEGRLTLDTEDDYKTICAYFSKPAERLLPSRSAPDPLRADEGKGANGKHLPSGITRLGRTSEVRKLKPV